MTLGHAVVLRVAADVVLVAESALVDVVVAQPAQTADRFVRIRPSEWWKNGAGEESTRYNNSKKCLPFLVCSTVTNISLAVTL